MPILFSPDGSLQSTARAAAAAGYQPLTIGNPLSVELRTFYPGPDIKEWNKKAELMISSQLRIGPQNAPPPQRVNIMVQGYDFKNPEPIQGVAGNNYGDMMLHYTKSYTGARLGVTVRGVELDKIANKRFQAATNAMDSLGSLAMFSSAAPYLAAASLATNVINLLIRAFSRNDPVLDVPADLRFKPATGGVLQSGRYLFWKGAPSWQTFANRYEIDTQNVLVKKSDGAAYMDWPYLVIEIDGKEKAGFKDFEIGAESAELLEQWGDKGAVSTTLNTIVGLAKQVNDAKQLNSIRELVGRLENASKDDEKKLIKAKIEAHRKLLTDDNSKLLKSFLYSMLG